MEDAMEYQLRKMFLGLVSLLPLSKMKNNKKYNPKDDY